MMQLLENLREKIHNNIIQLRKKGFFSLLLTKFLVQFVGFGSVILVAKFISPESMAQIKSLQTYLILAVLIGTFGLDTAILKYCSEPRKDNEKSYLLSYAIRRSIIFCVIAVLLFNLFLFFVPKYSIFQWGLYTLCIPMLAMTNILMSYLLALKKINRMAVIQSVIKVQNAVFIIIGTWLFGIKGFIIATVLGLLLGLLPLFKEINSMKISHKISSKVPYAFWNIAFFSFLANFTNNIGNYADIIIMDSFTTDRVEMGYYAIATIFLLGATQVTATLQSIYTPYLAEKNKDIKALKAMTFNIQKKTIIISIVVGVAVYIVSMIFVPIFYGEAYINTAKYTGILMIKYVLYSSYAITAAMLVSLGKMRENFYVTIISTPIALFSSYLAIQNFSVVGVAWAQVFNGLIILVLQYSMVFRVLKKSV
ncbi:lipopolysaccharide biosynthesis protein [Bacillus mycoides]|uniref:lipopolysaccharide biosynthesis protein n=1 Tax=Bacillus mycoides TaxID=1405 RepID=UPI001F12A138|nr:oligosaccharide flippase family protein [Bacillus mycoides]